jgi:predicted phosphoribosyltransferase
MEQLSDTVSCIDRCLFTRGEVNKRIVIVVRVDDGICTGAKAQVKAALDRIAQKIKIKDIGIGWCVEMCCWNL